MTSLLRAGVESSPRSWISSISPISQNAEEQTYFGSGANDADFGQSCCSGQVEDGFHRRVINRPLDFADGKNLVAFGTKIAFGDVSSGGVCVLQACSLLDSEYKSMHEQSPGMGIPGRSTSTRPPSRMRDFDKILFGGQQCDFAATERTPVLELANTRPRNRRVVTIAT